MDISSGYIQDISKSQKWRTSERSNLLNNQNFSEFCWQNYFVGSQKQNCNGNFFVTFLRRQISCSQVSICHKNGVNRCRDFVHNIKSRCFHCVFEQSSERERSFLQFCRIFSHFGPMIVENQAVQYCIHDIVVGNRRRIARNSRAIRKRFGR